MRKDPRKDWEDKWASGCKFVDFRGPISFDQQWEGLPLAGIFSNERTLLRRNSSSVNNFSNGRSRFQVSRQSEAAGMNIPVIKNDNSSCRSFGYNMRGSIHKLEHQRYKVITTTTKILKTLSKQLTHKFVWFTDFIVHCTLCKTVHKMSLKL